jgi:hypothetical protein
MAQKKVTMAVIIGNRGHHIGMIGMGISAAFEPVRRPPTKNPRAFSRFLLSLIVRKYRTPRRATPGTAV